MSHTHINPKEQSFYLLPYQYNNYYLKYLKSKNKYLLCQASPDTSMRLFLDYDTDKPFNIKPYLLEAVNNVLRDHFTNKEHNNIYVAVKSGSNNLHLITEVVAYSHLDANRNLFQRAFCKLVKREFYNVFNAYIDDGTDGLADRFNFITSLADDLDELASGIRQIGSSHPSKPNNAIYVPETGVIDLPTLLKYDPSYLEGYELAKYSDDVINEVIDILDKKEKSKFSGYCLNTTLSNGTTLTPKLCFEVIKKLPKISFERFWRSTAASILGITDQTSEFIELFDELSKNYDGYDKHNNRQIYEKGYKTGNFVKLAERYLQYKNMNQYERAFNKAEKFTPPNQLRTLEDMDFNFDGVNVVRSSCSTGKTKMLIKALPSYDTAIFITYRRSLARNLYDRLKSQGFELYSNIKGKIDSPKIIIQLESLWRLKRIDYSILIIDEIKSFFFQMESKFIKNALCYANTEYLLKHTKNIALLDAFWDESDARKFNLYNSIDNIFTNNYNPQRQCNLLKEKELIKNIVDDLNIGLNLVIPTNSKKFADKINKIIIKKTEIVPLIYTSDYNDDIEISGWDKTKCLIYSPVLESGVSFELEHFDKLYGMFYNNSTNVSSTMQMLYRVRNIRLSYNLCIRQMVGYKETDIHMLEQQIKSIYTTPELIGLNKVKRNENGELEYINKDEYYWLHIYNLQSDNDDHNNYIQKIIEHLIYDNFTVTINNNKPNDKELNTTIKEASAEVASEHIEQRIRDNGEMYADLFEPETNEQLNLCVSLVEDVDIPKYKRLKHREHCRRLDKCPTAELARHERYKRKNVSFKTLRENHNAHLVNYCEFMLNIVELSELNEISGKIIKWESLKDLIESRQDKWKPEIKLIGSLFGKRVQSKNPTAATFLNVLVFALKETYNIKVKILKDARKYITAIEIWPDMLTIIPRQINNIPFYICESIEGYESSREFIF